jgi:hypothetical protein
MDIKGYLFMICKDIFFHARYSRVHTTDLIFSEERQIFSEGFLSRHVYRHMSEKLRTILECHSQHD